MFVFANINVVDLSKKISFSNTFQLETIFINGAEHGLTSNCSYTQDSYDSVSSYDAVFSYIYDNKENFQRRTKSCL